MLAPAYSFESSDEEEGVVLGCSKCRFARRGCARCRHRPTGYKPRRGRPRAADVSASMRVGAASGKHARSEVSDPELDLPSEGGDVKRARGSWPGRGWAGRTPRGRGRGLRGRRPSFHAAGRSAGRVAASSSPAPATRWVSAYFAGGDCRAASPALSSPVPGEPGAAPAHQALLGMAAHACSGYQLPAVGLMGDTLGGDGACADLGGAGGQPWDRAWGGAWGEGARLSPGCLRGRASPGSSASGGCASEDSDATDLSPSGATSASRGAVCGARAHSKEKKDFGREAESAPSTAHIALLARLGETRGRLVAEASARDATRPAPVSAACAEFVTLEAGAPGATLQAACTAEAVAADVAVPWRVRLPGAAACPTYNESGSGDERNAAVSRDGVTQPCSLSPSPSLVLYPSPCASAGEAGDRGGRFAVQLAAAMAVRRGDRATRTEPSPLAAALEARQRRRSQASKGALEADGDARTATWEPPASPFGLIEEELYADPWRLLTACILLNKTSITQVRSVIWRLFELAPTPAALAAADPTAVRAIVEPLGLAPKRVPMLQRFSREYLDKDVRTCSPAPHPMSAFLRWRNPTELHGVGQYGADAYFMFCRGAWRAVKPQDKDLARYHAWLVGTGGEGTGLTREAATLPSLSPNPNPTPAWLDSAKGMGLAGEADASMLLSPNPNPVSSPALVYSIAASGMDGRGASMWLGSPAGLGLGSPGAWGQGLCPAGSGALVEVHAVPKQALGVGSGGSLCRSPLLGSCGAVASAAAAATAEGGMAGGVGDSVVR